MILATASPKAEALKIEEIHRVFNEVYGSTEQLNLKGINKKQLLVEKFGEKGFDYVGNSNADLIIFKSARYAYLVNPAFFLEKRANKVSNVKKCWKTKRNSFFSFLKLIRIYQWVKNLLLFLPIITSHAFMELNNIKLVIIAFFAFGLIASAGYIGNDIMDLNADRKHPRKKNRALASGKVSISTALVLSALFLFGGLTIAFLLNIQFFFILLVYFILSITYSVVLKKYVLYDVFLLALFYTIRVLAGGVVTGIPISFWLISFSIFIFLSLSFVKRYSEIFQIKTDVVSSRRGYTKVDIPLLNS